MSTNQAETAGCSCTAFGKCPFHSSKWLLHNGKTCGGLIKELEDTRELNAKAYGIIAKLEAENKLLREEWERMRAQLSSDYRRFTEEEFNCVWPDAAEEISEILSSLKFSPSQK